MRNARRPRRESRALAGRGSLLLLALIWTACRAEGGDARLDFFESKIRPVLVSSCLPCHGGKKTESGLSFRSREGLIAGGDRGPAVVPGKAESSLLVAAVRGVEPDLRMPPARALPVQAVADIVRWVNEGAVWPSDDPALAARSADRKPHWAFARVRPVAPPVDRTGWAESAIDAFLAARWSASGVIPARDAPRATLLRRLSFDLIGLPPTEDERTAFLADKSPLAYARLVDRLLASPHYGERWGRYWMDVARYADTAGDNADYPVPEAALYRDWIINAFNRDLPYDQFVRAQLAGDVLARLKQTVDPQGAVIATGFLALSRRYGTGPYELWHLTLEDTVDTTGRAFMGLTLRCARCHDHKFDPIPQRDYYALYGAFASTAFPYAGSEEFWTRKTPRKGFVAVGGNESTLAYGVAEGKPADVAVQRRGDPGQPGGIVPRGAGRFACLEMPPAGSAGAGESGRLALANWLVRPDHPLTARVIANRIWQHHFGRGLVATPSNFGRSGAAPTHPELLDWLATRLVASGWSIKALQREIVMSRAYRLASNAPAPSLAADPENRLYARFSPARLDAEAIRDAMLLVSGKLDRRMHGHHPFPPIKDWRWTQHSPFKAVYQTDRRSVYLMTQRLVKHPFLAVFDGPDTNVSTDARTRSTTPTQALYFLNNPFVREQASALADRLAAAASNPQARLEHATLAVWDRLPTPGESASLLGMIAHYKAAAGNRPGSDREAWASLAAVLFSSSEFLDVE